jgi:hypothetical protein
MAREWHGLRRGEPSGLELFAPAFVGSAWRPLSGEPRGGAWLTCDLLALRRIWPGPMRLNLGLSRSLRRESPPLKSQSHTHLLSRVDEIQGDEHMDKRF